MRDEMGFNNVQSKLMEPTKVVTIRKESKIKKVEDEEDEEKQNIN
jgi:hypothetical protein